MSTDLKPLERFSGLRVLVTGHTGFKGSWLSLWLHTLGAEVHGLALAPQSTRDNFVVARVEDLCRHHVFDIRDPARVIDLVSDVRPDVVFHLAAQSLVLPGYHDPWTTFTTNAVGTLALLEALRLSGGGPPTVIVTTDKVYQDREWPWGYREIDRLGGRDPYSASKTCAEVITGCYRESFLAGRLSLSTARAGNVVGAGDWAEQRLVPDVYRHLWDGVPLVLRHPSAVRPWQHVLEPLLGYLLLAAEALEEPEGHAGTWNFGPDPAQERTVLELVEALLAREEGGSIEVDPAPTTGHETSYLTLDNSKSRRHLAWRPVLDFETTVEFVAEGYRSDRGSLDPRSHRLTQIERFLDLAAYT
jgi:CDP-glucose 4,6-dehydratase